jgi:hypothetical protein
VSEIACLGFDVGARKCSVVEASWRAVEDNTLAETP